MSLAARLSLIASLAVLTVGLSVLGVTIYLTAPTSNTNSAAALGGPFTAVDKNGQPVTEAILVGKPTLMFFGFTHCPDVCPTKLYEIAQVMQRLGRDAERVNVVLVSVDPERDTPELLKGYVASFDERFQALTGTPAQIGDITRLWRAYVRKVPLEGSNYTMDHTAAVYLLDRSGRFVSTFDVTDPDRAAVALRARL